MLAGCGPKAAEPAMGSTVSAITTPTWTIDVIDVGTGLAVFVKGVDFELLYDAGSNDDRSLGANNRVTAFLRAAHPGLTRIKHAILSHPHRDHVELFPDVFAGYEVKNVWDSGAVNSTCGYRAFVKAVKAEVGVKYRSAKQAAGTHVVAFPSSLSCAGGGTNSFSIAHGNQILKTTQITLGTSATMRFLHADGTDHGNEYNDNTLVVRLKLGTTYVLLTGDAEGKHDRTAWPDGLDASSVEQELLTCCSAQLPAQILVVGHHGSLTSSRRRFLDAVGATSFVISSGPTKYSTVELPDTLVETELDARGEVYSTKKDEAACRTDPTKIGPDADGRPGGCHNIRITVVPGTPTTIQYLPLVD